MNHLQLLLQSCRLYIVIHRLQRRGGEAWPTLTMLRRCNNCATFTSLPPFLFTKSSTKPCCNATVTPAGEINSQYDQHFQIQKLQRLTSLFCFQTLLGLSTHRVMNFIKSYHFNCRFVQLSLMSLESIVNVDIKINSCFSLSIFCIIW